MGKTRVRVKGGKGKRWKKGHSGSSNPKTKKHRTAATGRFASHLSQTHEHLGLTVATLASHDAIQGELERDSDVELSAEEGSFHPGRSEGTSSAYSLMEAAHPVFGRVKRLWNSPLESHREICAVLAAISEVVQGREGKNTETEYLGALMTALESAEEEKAVTAITYLLGIVMPKVPPEVLQARYGDVCKVIAGHLLAYETSESTALLKALVGCLMTLVIAQDPAVWRDSYTQRIFQLLLNYTIHPKPKLRKVVQAGVVSLLREGAPAGDFHPSAQLTAKHCKYVIEKGDTENSILHVLGLLKDCLANFPSQLIKSLCETVLKVMTLGNSVIRTTGLKALHGLFTCVSGPQGLVPQLNGQIISALYDYQPNLVDAQLLQAWLTVMESAHQRLTQYPDEATEGLDIGLAGMSRFFSHCVNCLLCDKVAVKETATSAMQTILREVVGPCVEVMDSAGASSSAKKGHLLYIQHIQATFKVVEDGLKYRYYSSWDYVLRVMATFYIVAGRHCHAFMTKSLVSLSELRSTDSFSFPSELDTAFGAAVKAMGPRVVLKAVPLQLELESDPPDFPRSWILPVLKDSVQHCELAYFTESLLPLAGRLRSKAQHCVTVGKPLEAKLYDTLQLQVWSLLPGFCTAPVDIKSSFPSIARILGTALNERPDLSNCVCGALRLLVETTKESVEDRKELSRYSKNYLPILFNLYTSDDPERCTEGSKSVVLESIRAYVSITEQKLLESFYTKAQGKLLDEDLSTNTRYLVFDLVQVFVPHLSQSSLTELYAYLTPILDKPDRSLQKKAYATLEVILSCQGSAHQAFRREHLEQLRTVLLGSLSTASVAAKKPRLKCLLHLVDHLTPESSDFIAAIAPEVILCTKEVNEKARMLALKLLVNLGHAAQRCFQKSAEDAVTEYFYIVMAGLTGSYQMTSASLVALSRLTYEFHDLLSAQLVSSLLSNACIFLSSKTQEVVKEALAVVKVIVGILPPTELAPHVEHLVTGILTWGENSRNHFRLKARVIIERLIRKFSYEMIASMVPDEHKKLIVHIRKTTERQKRKKLVKKKELEGETTSSQKFHQLSYDELLCDSDEEEQDRRTERSQKYKQGLKAKRMQRAGQAWIKEDSGDELVDFLDPIVAKRVLASTPTKHKRRRLSNPFESSKEGKLVISEDPLTKGSEIMEAEPEQMEHGKGLSVRDAENEGAQTGGGRGIHRKNPSRESFEYGSEYKAKKAKGDIKKPGKLDPYAYIPLMRQKLNKRKKAKHAGQFSGIMKMAKKGSTRATRQLHRHKK